MIDAKTCINDAQEKMDMAVMYLEEALAHIRAGKASTRLLDGIRVDSYGSMVPISNVAAVTTPDARSIAIKPWDKSMFRIIEKAIMDSDLGITPENNGEIIRLGIPPLTEERRKQLAKQCKGEGETAKVSIRNARRDAIDTLKKAVKEGMPEDEQKNAEAKLQKVHDKYIAKIEELLAEKDSFELFTWMVMVLNEKDKRKQLLAKGIHGYMEVIAAYMIGIFMSPLLLEIMILAAKILGWIVCKIWV